MSPVTCRDAVANERSRARADRGTVHSPSSPRGQQRIEDDPGLTAVNEIVRLVAEAWAAILVMHKGGIGIGRAHAVVGGAAQRRRRQVAHGTAVACQPVGAIFVRRCQYGGINGGAMGIVARVSGIVASSPRSVGGASVGSPPNRASRCASTKKRGRYELCDALAWTFAASA